MAEHIPQFDPVVEMLAAYGGTDLLCYRAGDPARLVAREGEAWDPILAWARETLGARFFLTEGVMFDGSTSATPDWNCFSR